MKESLLNKENPSKKNKNSDNLSDHSLGSNSSGSSLSSLRLEDRYESIKIIMHVLLLIKKTLLTFARNKFPVIVTVFCPILWHLCIYYLNSTEAIMQEGQNVIARVGAVH